jgi:hypothetical protein
LLRLKAYWKIFALLGLAVANGRRSTAEPSLVSAHYYWQGSPAGNSAQLLTLFCRACEDVNGAGRDIPLVAVLRDTLGDSGIENDRVSYVWLLTYSRPTWEKRALSAVPFFYWKVGDGSSKVRTSDLKPLMNLSLPQHAVVSSSMRNVVQWTVLDPLTMSVRASTRAYRNNQIDHERLHLEEAESYLQSAPVTNRETGLTRKELDTVIARLELRKSMLGDFVSGHRAAEFGQNANFEDERIRARNWELLRQCADKTGLLFEAINLAGTRNQYAVLWYPTDRLTPPDGPRLGSIWTLLNLKDPYTQRDHLLKNTLYRRTWKGQTREVVPLGVYSLAYPKMPLLMVDFYDGTHLRRHELTQRAITEITSGVIGLSRFGNWYYFVGADLYDFYASRRGTAMNQTERLSCYSKFRVALALDSSVDPTLRSAMQQRIGAYSVNPLETSAKKELAAAVLRYDMLRASAADENSLFTHRLEKDRRIELARFEATKSEQVRDGIFHYASLALYTHQAKGDDFLARLDHYRRVDYDLNFLDTLSAAGTPPEVAYDRAHIERVLSELTALLPEIETPATRDRAERAIEKLHGLSADAQLKTECRAALDSMHGVGAASGLAEGSGTPETLR